jgi:hypothetical protein
VRDAGQAQPLVTAYGCDVIDEGEQRETEGGGSISEELEIGSRRQFLSCEWQRP